MNKLEKTIKGLECLAGMNTMKNNPCLNCGYQECQTYAICIEEIAADALSLLKEQEPVKPIMRREMDDICSCINNVAYCGKCGTPIGRLRQKYCLSCSQAVKWE